MNPIPHNSDSIGLRHQRRQLACWLAEWRLDQCLRKAIAAAGDSGGLPSATAERPRAVVASAAGHRTAVSVGQIRLLPPAPCMGADGRPVYVVVLEAHADKRYLVAPFGRFSTPADPGEWHTGLRAPPLRVLCLWNTRVVNGRVLADDCWLAGRLAPHKVAAAMEVYRHRKAGMPLTTVRMSRIGPPLLHPLDPRLRYQAEEAALLDDCLQTTATWGSVRGTGLVYEVREKRELMLAAEDRPVYGRPAGRKTAKQGRKKNADD